MSDDWRSYRQGQNGWSPTSGTNLTEWRRGRNHKLLGEAFNFSKHGNAGNMGAGVLLLLVIFGAIGLIRNLEGKSNKSTSEQSASQPQTTANSNAGSPETYAPIAKPPAGHPFEAPTVLPDSGASESVTPGTPSGVAAHGTQPLPEPAAPTSAAGSYRFAATHKEFGGGCEGALVLSNEGLHFSCPGQPNIDVPLAEIDRLDKDGVRLVSGKKYHFKISEDGKVEVESIFGNWLDRARQNRAAYSYSGSNTPAN